MRCLNLRHEGSLGELLIASGKGKAQLLITAPAEDEAPMDKSIETAYIIREGATEEPKPKTEKKETPVDTKQAEKDSKELFEENPPHAEEAAQAAKVAADKRAEEASQGEPPPPELIGHIVKSWLEESLKTLQDKGIKAYSDKNILSYLNAITKGKHKAIAAAVAQLDKAQSEAFVKKVQEARDMA